MRPELSDWLTTQLFQQLTAHQAVSVYATSLHCDGSFEDELLRRSVDFGLTPHTLSATETLSSRSEVRNLATGNLLLVNGIGRLADMDADEIGEILAPFRPAFSDLLGRGCRLLVLSDVPLLRVKSAIASMFLSDCFEYRLPRIDTSWAVKMCEVSGIENPERIVYFADGFPVLLDAFMSIARADLSGNERRVASDAAVAQALGALLDQFGPAVCGWLEGWILEDASCDVHRESVPDELFHTLKMCGVLDQDLSGVCKPFGGPSGERLRDTIADYGAAATDPGLEWTLTGRALFELERGARNMVREGLKREHGDGWKVAAFDEVEAAKILGTARGNLSRDVSIDELDPLSWLTLEATVAKGIQTANERGREIKFWQHIRNEVVPIRNRYAHMRLIRVGDRRTVMLALQRMRMVRDSFSIPPAARDQSTG